MAEAFEVRDEQERFRRVLNHMGVYSLSDLEQVWDHNHDSSPLDRALALRALLESEGGEEGSAVAKDVKVINATNLREGLMKAAADESQGGSGEHRGTVSARSGFSKEKSTRKVAEHGLALDQIAKTWVGRAKEAVKEFRPDAKKHNGACGSQCCAVLCACAGARGSVHSQHACLHAQPWARREYPDVGDKHGHAQEDSHRHPGADHHQTEPRSLRADPQEVTGAARQRK